MSEQEDCLRYLLPVVKYHARRLEHKMHVEYGEFRTQALCAALVTVEEYDAFKHVSLWCFAQSRIPQRLIDQTREEFGRYDRSKIPTPVDMTPAERGDGSEHYQPWEVPCEEGGYEEIEAQIMAHQCLGMVSEKNALLLELHDMHGVSLQEIATYLGLSGGALTLAHNKALAEARCALTGTGRFSGYAREEGSRRIPG